MEGWEREREYKKKFNNISRNSPNEDILNLIIHSIYSNVSMTLYPQHHSNLAEVMGVCDLLLQS